MILRILVAAAAAFAVAAPAASADMQYGGMTVRGTKMAGPSISLLRKDNGRVTGRLAFAYSCNRPRHYFPNLAARLSGTTNGVTFRVTAKSRPGGVGTLRFRLIGRFTPDMAVGKIRLRGCNGYTRSFSLRSPTRPLGAPVLPVRNAIMFGVTSQSIAGVRLPVTLRVANNGRVYANWHVRMKCGRSTFTWTNGTPPTKVRTDGRFSRSEHFTVRYSDGTSETYRVRFAGRFLTDGAIGTLRSTMQYHNNGTRYTTCRSGTQSWSTRG